jgi:hypothetical protein
MYIVSRVREILGPAAILLVATQTALAAPGVEFDFARSAKLRDVTTAEQRLAEPTSRVVELRLPVSVRFRGAPPEDVDEIDVEFNAAGAVLRVATFSPTTQLASDLTEPVKTTTTTKQASSLDGSLGGTLPIPYADLVAHLTPTINAATSRSKSATESTSRLPPQRAIVVSGTSAEGRGVFFKLKRSSQTSLEGVHNLAVSFVVPDDWDGGLVRVSCIARGQKKVMFVKQSAILGGETAEVKLRVPDWTQGTTKAGATVAASGELKG